MKLKRENKLKNNCETKSSKIDDEKESERNKKRVNRKKGVKIKIK